jgi:hypothetical protein
VPVGVLRRQPAWAILLYLSVLSHLQCVVYFNPQIAHRALQLRVPEEELNGSQILGPAVDQGRLRAPQSVRTVARLTLPPIA